MLDQMARAAHHIDIGFGPGVWGLMLEGGVGAGASYGMGHIYHRYGNHAVGKHVHKITAAVGKLGAIALNLFMGGGYHWSTGVFNAVGQAGIDAYFLEMGLRHARESTGKVAALLPAGTDLSKIPGAEKATSMGALESAKAGRGLSWDQIEALASMN